MEINNGTVLSADLNNPKAVEELITNLIILINGKFGCMLDAEVKENEDTHENIINILVPCIDSDETLAHLFKQIADMKKYSDYADADDDDEDDLISFSDEGLNTDFDESENEPIPGTPEIDEKEIDAFINRLINNPEFAKDVQKKVDKVIADKVIKEIKEEPDAFHEFMAGFIIPLDIEKSESKSYNQSKKETGNK